MGRIATSWKLMKQSWGVLRADKHLMVFPVISGVASLVVVAGFLVPIALATFLSSAGAGSSSSANMPVWAYPVLAVFYVVMAFVTIYFNSALMGAAMVRLQGGHPTLGDGFKYANSRLPAILGWAVITATVGMILRAIQERAGILGTIVAGLAGLAWQFVTYFVVPVLIFEGVGPIEGIKRSASLVKERWGEQIAGSIGIGAAGMILAIPGIIAIVAGAVAGAATKSFVIGGILVGGGILWLVGLSIVTSAMQGIYNCALYRFATVGDGGGIFSNEDLAGTFRTKDGRNPLTSGWAAQQSAQVPPYGTEYPPAATGSQPGVWETQYPPQQQWPAGSGEPQPQPPSRYTPEPPPPGDILPQ